MNNLPNKRYLLILGYSIYISIILADIIWSICDSSRYLTVGFLSIILSINYPRLRKYLIIELYKAFQLSIIILCAFMTLYFILAHNTLNAFVVGIVGLLILVRKDTIEEEF